MNREQIEKWMHEAAELAIQARNDGATFNAAMALRNEHFARLVRTAALDEAKEACLSWGEEHRIEAGEAVDEHCEYRIAAETLADAIEALKVKP